LTRWRGVSVGESLLLKLGHPHEILKIYKRGPVRGEKKREREKL